MQAGRLRHRVFVQTYRTAADAYGQPRKAWADAYGRWAEVVSLQGAELWRARQVQASVTHRVTLRGDPDTLAIPPDARIRLGERYFNVLWTDDVDGRGREARVYCVERPAAAAREGAL